MLIGKIKHYRYITKIWIKNNNNEYLSEVVQPAIYWKMYDLGVFENGSLAIVKYEEWCIKKTDEKEPNAQIKSV